MRDGHEKAAGSASGFSVGAGYLGCGFEFFRGDSGGVVDGIGQAGLAAWAGDGGGDGGELLVGGGAATGQGDGAGCVQGWPAGTGRALA